MDDLSPLRPLATSVETGKSANDRLFVQVLYGLHTLAWFSAGTFAVVALIINYIRRSDETDALYLAHHRYMIRTFWWTVAWLVLASPLWLLLFPGLVSYGVIGLWYLYRCIKGWLRFNASRWPTGSAADTVPFSPT